MSAARRGMMGGKCPRCGRRTTAMPYRNPELRPGEPGADERHECRGRFRRGRWRSHEPTPLVEDWYEVTP